MQACRQPSDRGGSPPLRGLGAADAARLARLPMFADLSAVKRAEIIEEASVVSVSRRTVLFYQGEPATRFYVVLDGCVMLHRVSPNGHQSVISLINRGESFAEAAMFDCADFPVTATVISVSSSPQWDGVQQSVSLPPV